MDDIKIVYSMRETFVKAQTYRNLTPSRTDSMFNTGNVDTHRRYRRMLARPMSESALKPNIDDVHARVSNTVSKMEAEMKTRGAVDIYKWWFFFTTDTIGDLTFGTSFNMTESGQKNQYFMDLQAVNKLGGIRVMFPALIKLAKYVPIPFVKAAQQGGERIRRYAIRLLEAQQKGGSSDCTKDTFFSNIIRANNEETLSFEEVVVNAQSYIVAGSDTTSNTLTFLIWAVVHRPDIQEKLVAELKTLPEDFTEADTRQLKYLDQVIHETLRLFAAAPTTLPREVPAEGVELGGYRVDGGTTVGTSAYMMHRNDKIFPEPFEYKPERWAEPTKEMKDAFMAFGRGARSEYLFTITNILMLTDDDSLHRRAPGHDRDPPGRGHVLPQVPQRKGVVARGHVAGRHGARDVLFVHAVGRPLPC